jgi:hypothetical protein
MALHYRAATPSKYHSNRDPHKFLMYYEAVIASAGCDEATLTKSLIISLEDVAANWYFRLSPRCIYSWQHLKDKILLNFQGFQVQLDTEEDFLSCIQKEREPLPEFYRRFLQLKAQAPEVSNEQVIAQSIKAFRAGPLHSHFVRERPKTVSELYDQFVKFSKSEIQHFRKLEQQRKVAKPDESSRPHYGNNHRNYPKLVHNIGPDSDGASENWNKSYREPSHHSDSGTPNQRSPQSNQRGGASNRGRERGRGPYTPRLLYCIYHGNEINHHTKDCPIYIDTKRKMNQDTTQPSSQLQSREVSHTIQ